MTATKWLNRIPNYCHVVPFMQYFDPQSKPAVLETRDPGGHPVYVKLFDQIDKDWRSKHHGRNASVLRMVSKNIPVNGEDAYLCGHLNIFAYVAQAVTRHVGENILIALVGKGIARLNRKEGSI